MWEMSTRSKGTISPSTRESLCCCEYRNMYGEKSHVLASCCDCEALDETVDKIFKCERIPGSTLDRLATTIVDRCRVPSCFGQGAVKLRLDVFAPIIIVPTCLCLATLHPIMTVLCFLFMPLAIVIFHAILRRQGKSQRTVFFYSWGMTSIICSYLVFQFFVVAFREILLWEILTVFTSMMIMFYFLYRTKRDPYQLRIVRKMRPVHKRTPSNGLSPMYDQINSQVVGQQPYNGELVDVMMEGTETTATTVTSWIESRSEAAKSDLPPRAGYCKICEYYIAVRDHHCIWIDSCVGGHNHRSFFLTMLTFVLTGAYACHLTFTTICTPKMYYNWFLLPNDCRWLYNDFLTSICFVTAVYSIIVTILVCYGLLFQIILISQNVTSHELAHAHRQGMTRCLLFARNNPHNQGFLRNWMAFWFLDSRTAISRSAT